MGAAEDTNAPPQPTLQAASEAVRFETHPDRYRHWRLGFDGPVACLGMDVKEDGGLRPPSTPGGYPLKLNSYDLGVDIELADALDRIRFEHPEVRAIRFSSLKDRIFCSGANIYMLGGSSHAFKVNFCKFTNETRIGLEEMSKESGIHSLAALAGTASGGGYELAIACDEIVLAEDGSSAVSLPEAPLLGVLPGTGGLTRLVDKRRVRRDLADVFSTLAEGVRGKRAVEWGLVDEAPPKAKFDECVKRRLDALIARSMRKGPGVSGVSPDREAIPLSPIGSDYKYVKLDVTNRTATLTVRGANDKGWALRAFRELDLALLDLRFSHPLVGVVAVKTEGEAPIDPPPGEVLLLVGRVLRRMDMTAKSFFTLIEPGSCFVGPLLELALASDRIYMKDEKGTSIALSQVNAGALPTYGGLSRLETRFLREPERVSKLLETKGPLDTQAALKAGLVTFAPDDIDWDDEVRIAFEERASLSPDAMTGMEASLRFAGPETMETKIFGRLTAWQNWIFQRPNAVGEKGALTLYGKPERPEFDWRRT
jgi:benzoyl-CoA-dihydrodiol lyase